MASVEEFSVTPYSFEPEYEDGEKSLNITINVSKTEETHFSSDWQKKNSL